MFGISNAWKGFISLFKSEEVVETTKKPKKKRVVKKKVVKAKASTKSTKAKKAKVNEIKTEVKVEEAKTTAKKKNLTKAKIAPAAEAVALMNTFKEASTEKNKKRYMTRLINGVNKAIEAKDLDAVVAATEKVTNYLEKNKG